MCREMAAAVETGDVADQPGHETYFAKPEHFFPHLTDDGKIPTAQFLSACQGIADFVCKESYFSKKKVLRNRGSQEKNEQKTSILWNIVTFQHSWAPRSPSSARTSRETSTRFGRDSRRIRRVRSTCRTWLMPIWANTMESSEWPQRDCFGWRGKQVRRLENQKSEFFVKNKPNPLRKTGFCSRISGKTRIFIYYNFFKVSKWICRKHTISKY